MRKYIYHFDTEADFNEMRSVENYDEPWVSLTEDVERIDFNKTEEEKERERLLEMPLTFEIQSDGDIVWKTTNTGYTKTIEYSKDNGETWTNITSAAGNTAPSISVVSGDTVQFRGNNANYGTGSPSYYNCFSGSTAQFSVKGNIMSLINSTDFKDISTISSTYCFSYLFYNCIGLTVASKLLLPATTLAERCYSNMFNGCTSLTTAPELPATTLAQSCYYQMFYGCTSLAQAPVLPATTLASNCYSNMFAYCTSLTQAPELPATTLANNCYGNMFEGCTSLTQAPTLPATILTSSCYSSMFWGCSNLNYIKCLATDISATGCTNYWINGVASSGTFVKPASTDWSSKTGISGIPEGWTVQDA